MNSVERQLHDDWGKKGSEIGIAVIPPHAVENRPEWYVRGILKRRWELAEFTRKQMKESSKAK